MSRLEIVERALLVVSSQDIQLQQRCDSAPCFPSHVALSTLNSLYYVALSDLLASNYRHEETINYKLILSSNENFII